MSDIRQMMGNIETTDPDVADRLGEMEGWTEETARYCAAEEGLEMTPAHWEVIGFLQQYFLEHGRARSARVLTEALEKRFRKQGGRKYLYQLFPRGPVAQGSRIAGLPLPDYSENPSFGSVQ